ncbi:MAG TPA: ABC transporter substrate-binding protein [Trueperaceae bacterium]|nr:ABC transporter substrate-binding protein [Trueperaceae bacterium]HRP46481.1 ABC transporter substrate-binding protein [Trueperaceae bacterium]
MHSRTRQVLALAFASLLTFGAAQSATPTVHAAMEAVGTFSWVVHGMDYFGTAAANGIEVVGTPYASKQATEIALRSGEADVKVDDFLGPVLLRDAGIMASGIYPYATAVGGLVVGSDSTISSPADLKGKTIAAGSLRDKSLLILRALTISEYGFDPQTDGEVVAAAPPLMQQLTASGEVDAALPLWHWVARMEAAGVAREIMTVADMLGVLGLPSDLPNLVVVARDDMPDELKTAFIATLQDTVDIMMATPSDDPFWQSILDLELYSLPDPSQFPLVVDRWKLGTTSNWTQESIDGLVNMVDRLVALAGAEVVGVERVDPAAFTTQFVPR